MKGHIEKRKRNKNGSYAKMLRQLLLQNQQIIIQNQNMMFMVMKQFGVQQPNQQQQAQRPQQIQSQQHMHTTSQQSNLSSSQPSTSTATTTTNTIATPRPTLSASQPLNGQHQQPNQQQQTNLRPIAQSQQQDPHHQHLQQHHHTLEGDMSLLQQNCQQLSSQMMASGANNVVTGMEGMHTMVQQVSSQPNDCMSNHLQENMGHYLTPAASEQDPISDDKQEDDELAAAWDDDGLLNNNFMYNPQTDIGVVTPYKNQPNQHQTPSYYSSDCESLSTPRVEQQRPPLPPVNITQHAVKNLADSFKSPTKPKINIQFLSGPATKDMKNNKVKIIQRMNIPKFLRSVHPDGDTN